MNDFELFAFAISAFVAIVATGVALKSARHRVTAFLVLGCALCVCIASKDVRLPLWLWFAVSGILWLVIPARILLSRFGKPRFSLAVLLLFIMGCAVGVHYNASFRIQRDIYYGQAETDLVTVTHGFPIVCTSVSGGIHPRNSSAAEISGTIRASGLRIRHKMTAYLPMVANAAFWLWLSAGMALGFQRFVTCGNPKVWCSRTSMHIRRMVARMKKAAPSERHSVDCSRLILR